MIALLPHQIQKGQHNGAGDSEEGYHNAMHGGKGHMGDSDGIQQPEEKTAHNDIADDFFHKPGKEEERHNDDDDTGNAISAQGA